MQKLLITSVGTTVGTVFCLCLWIPSAIFPQDSQDLSGLIKKLVTPIGVEMNAEENDSSAVLKDTLLTNAIDSIESIDLTDAQESIPTKKPVNAVYRFYKARNYKSVWFDSTNFNDRTETFLEVLSKTPEDGLYLWRYQYPKIKSLYALTLIDLEEDTFDEASANNLATLDVELTKAALQLINDLRLGVVNPKELYTRWEIPRDSIDIVALLNEGLQSEDIAAFFDDLKPQNEYYNRLKKSLVDLRKKGEMDTTSVVLKNQQKLEFGDTDKQVDLLRQRLQYFYSDVPQDSIPNVIKVIESPISIPIDTVVEKQQTKRIIKYVVKNDTIKTENDSIVIVRDSTAFDTDSVYVSVDSFTVDADSFLTDTVMVYNPQYFDSLLLKQVKQFQKDYGLRSDGVVGPMTIGKLNASGKDFVELVEINLDRWRWLPRDLGEEYLMVNIAGFYLDVFEGDSSVLHKIVVVGSKSNATPVFSDVIRYIELNPSWTVPYSISTTELLPKIKKNPDYLPNNSYELLSGGKAINPHSVDWSEIKSNKFPYVIRQKPGRQNALGEIKFMFPNRYNVYIHDTQAKSKFKLAYRAYSHGCVRLQKPMELANHLFRKDDKWTPEKLESALYKRRNKRIDLPEPMPVYLLYFTAWVDGANEFHFQEDIYKRDNDNLEIWKEQKAQMSIQCP